MGYGEWYTTFCIWRSALSWQKDENPQRKRRPPRVAALKIWAEFISPHSPMPPLISIWDKLESFYKGWPVQESPLLAWIPCVCTAPVNLHDGVEAKSHAVAALCRPVTADAKNYGSLIIFLADLSLHTSQGKQLWAFDGPCLNFSFLHASVYIL